MSTEIHLPLTVADIKEILPHRYPMLLVDRVTDFETGKRIVGFKNLTANEQFFEGHFPGLPIFPGVMILEALAQLGVIFSKLMDAGVDDKTLIVFAGVDSAKFRRQVVPGDVLTLEMQLLKRRAGIWKMAGTASVDGEKAAEAVLTAAESKIL